MNKNLTPGIQLLHNVRAGFVSQGLTLNRWCTQNGVLYANARQALIGTWNGDKGTELRNKIIAAATIYKG